MHRNPKGLGVARELEGRGLHTNPPRHQLSLPSGRALLGLVDPGLRSQTVSEALPPTAPHPRRSTGTEHGPTIPYQSATRGSPRGTGVHKHTCRTQHQSAQNSSRMMSPEMVLCNPSLPFLQWGGRAGSRGLGHNLTLTLNSMKSALPVRTRM